MHDSSGSHRNHFIFSLFSVTCRSSMVGGIQENEQKFILKKINNHFTSGHYERNDLHEKRLRVTWINCCEDARRVSDWFFFPPLLRPPHSSIPHSSLVTSSFLDAAESFADMRCEMRFQYVTPLYHILITCAKVTYGCDNLHKCITVYLRL